MTCSRCGSGEVVILASSAIPWIVLAVIAAATACVLRHPQILIRLLSRAS